MIYSENPQRDVRVQVATAVCLGMFNRLEHARGPLSRSEFIRKCIEFGILNSDTFTRPPEPPAVNPPADPQTPSPQAKQTATQTAPEAQGRVKSIFMEPA